MSAVAEYSDTHKHLMRICLLSLTYPPRNSEGIPRQRQALALTLARQGHDVHVVTIGQRLSVRSDRGVTIHEIAVPTPRLFSEQHAEINSILTSSQALYEVLQQINAEQRVDIVDVPFWAAQGLVTSIRFAATVIWLQTSTAQLIEIEGRSPKAFETVLLDLEQKSLEFAAGVLSDSHVALEQIRRHYTIPNTCPVGVAYLGLPALDNRVPAARPADRLELLVVGRLERRKGTPLLFDILPDLLRRCPDLHVRFIGRDNSGFDGWKQTHGDTYVNTFSRRFPDLSDRVHFDGFVDDRQLAARYRQSTLLVVPSLYESFGLMYLEAMRVGLPIITFDSGSALEVFPQGIEDGAMLVPATDVIAFAQAIEQLVYDPELRHQIGMAGYRRFRDNFTDQVMADQTVTFYQQVIRANQQRRLKAVRVYQVMEAMSVGDAVSDITRDHIARMALLNQPSVVLARHTHPQVTHLTQALDRALQPGNGLIFHYWNYNQSAWLLDAVSGPKAIYYHNITPAHFFEPGSPGYINSARGYQQLRRVADSFDLVIGDSDYNISEFIQYTNHRVPYLHIYPVINRDMYQLAPYSESLLYDLQHSNEVNIVFVGRVARNKRQDRLMRLFEYYYRSINRRCRLWLVGNDQTDSIYRSELEQLRNSLASRDRIIFTGKVSEPEMMSYFRGAHVFVCASEHEGFCVPLIQAMALDIPVMAYASTAVPETMGDAGILINTWDVPRVAEMMNLLITDKLLYNQVITRQQANVLRFSSEEAHLRLEAVVNYLCERKISPLFEWTS